MDELTKSRIKRLNKIQREMINDLQKMVKRKSPALYQYAKYVDNKEEKEYAKLQQIHEIY